MRRDGFKRAYLLIRVELRDAQHARAKLLQSPSAGATGPAPLEVVLRVQNRPFRPLFQSTWGFCFVPARACVRPARFDLASRRFLTVAGMMNTSADYLSNRICTAVRTKARGKTEHVRRRADEREGEKRKKKKGVVVKKGCNPRTSQGVTDPSTTLAQARFTSEF